MIAGSERSFGPRHALGCGRMGVAGQDASSDPTPKFLIFAHHK